MINTKLFPRDWHIVLQWTAFSTYGMMLSLPIAFAIMIVWSFLSGNVLHLAISSFTADLIIAVIFASTTGAFLGGLQSRVLKLQNVHTRGWIAASTTGLSIGAACVIALQNQSSLIQTTNSYLSIGAVLGAVLGIAQWFVLRDQIAKLGWWVVGSLAGGILSTTIIHPLIALGNAIEAPWNIVFFLIFFAFAVGIIYSISTGILLSWLLKARDRELQEAG